MLFRSVSEEAGQAAPPSAGASTTRTRRRVPATSPQDLLQPVQLPHSDVLQSCGHWCVLHQRASVADGQILPPKLGCTTARLRDCMPPRHEALAPCFVSVKPNGASLWWRPPVMVQHDFVHADQALNSLRAQSTGHGWALHPASSVDAEHRAPPYRAAVVERLRVLVPEPHESVQALQALQAPLTQSTGQKRDRKSVV